ncbi:pyroglutamyl-peptidase I [Vagococcus intermedius]|uniref:Pyroglutamyl-peptidase I n=1 Tax=Vagococcus intermedius TaxID=2991418 RepID=A0AAF0CU91_9ENTE|nr:pyroglutamyl-peptidase I [Vagococcus intermedius]WEG73028.1 pyroglutamyl-peptidase I [Vagococcus intermedius]WEG75113.1 pyroglutamyl-peptidase I [Vagococcus intermedius]
MKILLTGFKPFGNESCNPSWEAVKLVPESLSGASIIKLELPTVFGKATEVLYQTIESEHPDIVLNLGQAGGRAGLSLERVAINIADARIPDNEGNQPIDEPIRADGAPAYFSTLPLKEMALKMSQAGYLVGISNTAGTFVCNQIMYDVHYLIDKQYNQMKAGFIHVPYNHQQVDEKRDVPSMSNHDMSQALVVGLERLIELKGEKSGEILLGGSEH